MQEGDVLKKSIVSTERVQALRAVVNKLFLCRLASCDLGGLVVCDER